MDLDPLGSLSFISDTDVAHQSLITLIKQIILDDLQHHSLICCPYPSVTVPGMRMLDMGMA